MFLTIWKFGLIAMAALAAAWMGAAPAAAGEAGKSRVLIVYFSHTGTTHGIAERLQKKIGGAFHRIEPVNSYPEGREAALDQGKKETADSFKPELKGEPPRLDDIDLVLVGGPVWYGTLAPPLLSFLAKVDLKGKTVAPFCTYGGGIRDYFQHFKMAISKEATVLEGLGLSKVNEMQDGDIEKALDAWLAKFPK